MHEVSVSIIHHFSPEKWEDSLAAFAISKLEAYSGYAHLAVRTPGFFVDFFGVSNERPEKRAPGWFRVYRGLPNYIITINHYKDPYLTTSIMKRTDRCTPLLT